MGFQAAYDFTNVSVQAQPDIVYSGPLKILVHMHWALNCSVKHEESVCNRSVANSLSSNWSALPELTEFAVLQMSMSLEVVSCLFLTQQRQPWWICSHILKKHSSLMRRREDVRWRGGGGGRRKRRRRKRLREGEEERKRGREGGG